MSISSEYLNTLPEIYREILSAFPDVEPSRRVGWGLAYQTLFGALESKYSMGEIVAACENMEQGGAVTIKNRFFVHPTKIGEEMIAGLTGAEAPPTPKVPPFSPPPVE